MIQFFFSFEDLKFVYWNSKAEFSKKICFCQLKKSQMRKSHLFCFWEINLTREGWKLCVIFNYVSFGQERGLVADFITWWAEGLVEKKTITFCYRYPFLERYLIRIFRDYHKKFCREENNCIPRLLLKTFYLFLLNKDFLFHYICLERENRGIHLLFPTQTILPHNQNKIWKKKTSWIIERIKSTSLGYWGE